MANTGSAIPNFIFNPGYKSPGQIFERGDGCHLIDTTGKEYIDCCLGQGTHVLGHSSELIVQRATEQLKSGTLFVAPNDQALEAAQAMAIGTNARYRFAFCNSGTEANTRLVRIARAYTRRNKIAIFSGGWHGSSDEFLIEDDYSLPPKAAPSITFKSSGLPTHVRDSVILLPYNTTECFEIIRKYADDLAVVIIEPAQGSNPQSDIGEFLQELRQVTLAENVCLASDEVITGWRTQPGELITTYDVYPDLISFGKIIGGGLPIGCVGISPEINSRLFIPKKEQTEHVFLGGTFSANPLSMCLVATVINHLNDNSDRIYSHLNQAASRIRKELNSYSNQYELPFHISGVGSFMRPIFVRQQIGSRREREHFELGDKQQYDFFQKLFHCHQIFFSSNPAMFLSIHHDQLIVTKVIDAFKEELQSLRKTL